MDTMTRDRYLIQQLNNKFTKNHVMIENLVLAHINDHNPQDFFPEKQYTSSKKECYVLTPRRLIYGLTWRPDRRTPGGYWHCTDHEEQQYANDRNMIHGMNGVLGAKRSFCFYEGQPNQGHNTSWKMTEYKLLQHHCSIGCNHRKDRLDEWVLCRVYYDFAPQVLSLEMQMMGIN